MSGSKNTRAHKRQQQVQHGSARQNGDVSLQAFAQPHLGQQVRGMTGGDMFFPVIGASGSDPRLEFYLMQQRNQQERVTEMTSLEQQRLASLDPDSHMRMFRAGSAYHGFPPGMNANLMSQPIPFNQHFDPTNNATAAMFMNERMATMRQASSQQQHTGSAPASLMQIQQQQDQQPPPIVGMSMNDQFSPPAGPYASGRNHAQDSVDGDL